MDVRTRKFTVTEYYDMWERGYFEGQRVQLINGEIVEMAPQSNPHAWVVVRVRNALQRAFPEDAYSVLTQSPLALDESNHPEPDAFVVKGSLESLEALGHPTTAELVVEVAKSSLSFDRRQKGPMYAQAGIAEYWILNLANRTLEVRRNPVGKTYKDLKIYKPGESVSPLAMKSKKIKVGELLP
jgi:Uma2 family endonuclease